MCTPGAEPRALMQIYSAPLRPYHPCRPFQNAAVQDCEPRCPFPSNQGQGEECLSPRFKDRLDNEQRSSIHSFEVGK